MDVEKEWKFVFFGCGYVVISGGCAEESCGDIGGDLNIFGFDVGDGDGIVGGRRFFE